jgi:hypothetical protein
MKRTLVLSAGLLVALPLCLAIGASSGFYLLLVLYVVFGIDFPTEVSIIVGLMPVFLSLVGLGLAYNRFARSR